MVLKVKKVISMLEECCACNIFALKQYEIPQISPQILRKAQQNQSF